MDIRVLQYFLAVAREQTVSGAAQSLHMTQPSLSKQLKTLEDELGKQLFIRGSRHIPSPGGSAAAQARGGDRVPG